MATSASEVNKQKNFLSSPIVLATALRTLMFAFLVVVLDKIIDFGTSPIVLVLSVAAGVLAASYFYSIKLKTTGLIALSFVVWIVSEIGLWLVSILPAPEGFQLYPYSLSLHTTSCLLVAAVCVWLTWFFWKTRWGLTTEAVALALIPVSLLAGHRHLHLDRPKFLGDIAWYMQQGTLETVIIIGVASLLVLGTYVYLLNRAWTFAAGKGAIPYDGTKRVIASVVVACISALMIYFISSEVFNHYNETAMTRTANGVGQAGSEDASPLGFHSALGGSNQPSALVRLDGDYRENPFLPMLYIRESALSEFNGNEMVVADPKFNPDVQTTTPTQAYVGDEDASLIERVPMTHSVYVMADHKRAFAIDYPVSITRLKPPSNRFKQAYKVYSVAPAFSLDSLLDKEVGDPRWDEETRQHFLKLHGDERYGELASKISAEKTTPVSKARAIVDYLSKTAIYTLSPNHEVEPGADPVAPFLFGDNRGYCVHFAHAMVYMFRSLGIPARIGTGYLTDLSQSKDGHVLLRMSDRHAWAEVYIKEYGWIPFDPQPEQVESHAESPVDMNLLEELMGILEPDEEILPEELTQDEFGFAEEAVFPLPDISTLVYFLSAVLILLALAKAFLLYGWMLPIGSRQKLAYASSSAFLYDLGFRRNIGETKEEFRKRLIGLLGKDPLSLTPQLNAARYGSLNLTDDISFIKKHWSEDATARVNIPLWKRAIGFFNPASVLRCLRGQKW